MPVEGVMSMNLVCSYILFVVRDVGLVLYARRFYVIQAWRYVLLYVAGKYLFSAWLYVF